MKVRLLVIAAFTLTILLPGFAAIQGFDDLENEAIQYRKRAGHDAITTLQARLDSGAVRLTHEPQHGYLKSVLSALGIPVSSQMLVFSKTSFQRDLISPNRPRALYFNDNTYIGWVQGGRVLEVATVDPQLGSVFYVLDQSPAGKPKFIRQTDECLQCHYSTMTGGVPGQIMRSVYSGPDGQPDLRAGSYVTTDQSPWGQRWGGWYVTGTHGLLRHMGNATSSSYGDRPLLDVDKHANLTALGRIVDIKPYLTGQSDIVALMLLAHQSRVQNLITKVSYETRLALAYEEVLNKALNRPAGTRAESTLSRIRSVCEPLVKALLFSSEEHLLSTVKGTSGFAEQFSTRGIKDHLGRSLYQLDLSHRMLRYPCSYLIYSEAFNQLPPMAKQYVYERMDQVLSGKEQSGDFNHLSSSDRTAIREILSETKGDFVKAVARPAQTARAR